MMGYLNGIAIEILVGRVFKQVPHHSAVDLVQKFFETYSNWDWRTAVAIPGSTRANSNGNVQINSPLGTNVTPNVTKSHKNIIIWEFRRGAELLRGENFDALFAKLNFFSNYIDYILVNLQTNANDTTDKMTGAVESRIRGMAVTLERNSRVDSVRIPTKRINVREHQNVWVLGLKLKLGGVLLQREIQAFVVEAQNFLVSNFLLFA